MNSILIGWLDDIANDKLVISPENISKETTSNCWSFKFQENHTPKEIEIFFNTILENWSKDVLGRMTFYVWFDEMSNNLCCCIASASKNNLPFGCSINHTENLNEILSRYCSSHDSDIISFHELEEVPVEEAFFDEQHEKQYELMIWSKEVEPRSS